MPEPIMVPMMREIPPNKPTVLFTVIPSFACSKSEKKKNESQKIVPIAPTFETEGTDLFIKDLEVDLESRRRV